MTAARRVKPVSKATRASLREAAVLASPLAQTALALAAMVDDPETPATARVAAAKELRSTLEDATRGVQPAGDTVDELKRRREERLRRGA